MSPTQDSLKSPEPKASFGAVYRTSLIAFFAWLIYLPGLALFLASGNASGGAANAAPAGLVVIALCGLALGFVVAVAVGIGTKTLAVSLIGLLMGLPLSALVYVSLYELGRSNQRQVWEKERREVRAIAGLVAAGNRESLRKTLTAPEARSSAILACALNDLKSERDEGWPKIPLALNAVEVLMFAEVALETDLSPDERQALMYVTLTSLGRRDSQNIQFLNDWFALWRRAAHGDTTEQADARWRFSRYEYGCSWGNATAMASTIFSTWKDRGIAAWLDGGFALTSEQFQVVLRTVESAEVLERAVATGVDVHAVGPADGKVAGVPLPLVARANAWSRQLDGDEWSEETVKLAVVLARLATKETRAEACTVFVKNEVSRKNVLEGQSDPNFSYHGFKPDTPLRGDSAAALHSVLCKGVQ